MNDRPDLPASEDETPELAEVRRLLADARHDEPMPDDVAARMDRVIATLGRGGPARRPEPGPEPGEASVIPISAARRRRVAGLLVAAAAIVVGGVVVQNVHLTSGGDAGRSSATAADSGGEQYSSGNTGTKEPNTPSSESATTPVKVHPQRFSRDATKARHLLGSVAYDAQQDDTAKLTAGCIDVPKHARAVPATYKRAPAALVYLRPRGGTQVVNLYVCHSAEPIRSTTLPVP